MSKVGIFGGTFNPIHCGHLMISEFIREECGLEEIIFVPTGNPPHKTVQVDAKMRNDMVRIAVRDNPYFCVSDIETNREGNSYTIDTIEQLQQSDCREMYFLIGLDTLFELKTWKNIECLAKKIHFIVALRPGYMNSDAIEQEISQLQDLWKVDIQVISTPLYEISSTELRARIAEDKSVRYLLPDEVMAYIEEKGLYRKESHGCTKMAK